MSKTIVHHPSSYRDPSGFVFEANGVLYRQVNIEFKEQFDRFMQGGCYDHLVKKGLLIPHEQTVENLSGVPNHYQTIRPEKIRFISYPYEWSFDMLKDAALLTLQLVREALAFDMILKDASPYNIQWHKGKFIFIDTLSFEKYEEAPWIAYRQFCECFLAPLLLMHYGKKQMPELLLAWPDGIPIAIASSLLPRRSKFSLHAYLHIHLHARISQNKKNVPASPAVLSKQKLLNLIRSLELLLNKLKSPTSSSVWSEYYDEAARRKDYLDSKRAIITDWINKLPGVKSAIDLGANEGEFSEVTAARNIHTIAADFDAYCINKLYKKITERKEQNLQPLVLDLSHPSPAIGVNNDERKSFIDRADSDLVMALALIHHLAIGKNIPFDMIARTFSSLGKALVVEYVPKEDEKIKLMLGQKKDIYFGYSEANFVKAFESYFTIEDKKIISGSGRTLYLMKRNEG